MFVAHAQELDVSSCGPTKQKPERKLKEALRLIPSWRRPDTGKKMNITLTPELETLVREKVARGEYDTADALVGAAIQRFIDEQNEEDAHEEEIRTRIDAAEAEIDRGDYVEYDENTIRELGKEIHQRGLKRLADERDKTSTRG